MTVGLLYLLNKGRFTDNCSLTGRRQKEDDVFTRFPVSERVRALFRRSWNFTEEEKVRDE